jgi:hypothetical protein
MDILKNNVNCMSVKNAPPSNGHASLGNNIEIEYGDIRKPPDDSISATSMIEDNE